MDLEHRLQALRDQLTRPNLAAEERKRIELRMEMSELALQHYLEAYELERKSSA